VFVLGVTARLSQPKLPAVLTLLVGKALEQPETRSSAVRTIARLGLADLDEALGAVAANPQAPRDVRIEALGAMLRRRPKVDAAGLELLLAPFTDSAGAPLRLAAAEALGRCELTGPQLAAALEAVGSDALISPDTLLPMLARSASQDSAEKILDYLDAAAGRGWRADETRLSPLLEILRKRDAGRVRALLENAQGQMAEVRRRLEAYQPLLQGGDAQAGRAVFFGGVVACATCHRIGEEGGRVGPDLTRVGAIRSGRDLLESIVAPSSTFAQGYESYIVTTRAGETLAGILVENTAEGVVLRESGGAELRIGSAQVRRMRREEVSMMPEGLDRALTREQLRDLLAFLQSLK
jgi:putative heme-binding domain-containing protein